MIIKFTPEQIKECEDFSNAVDTSFYATRNQKNNEKRVFDSKIGKLGEIATFEFLNDKVKNLTRPDFKIYKPSEKSWDFDLKSDGMNIHVKSQAKIQSQKFGESWIFQKGDKKRGYDKEIFDKLSENQFISFVIVDPINKQAEIKAIVSLDLLHDKDLFALPVIPYLRNMNKVAVYFKDLINHKQYFLF